MKILSKVARGVAYGDVSNAAVRNILTEISKGIKGKFTEQEMIDTMEEFNWRCPYTGRDLRNLKDCVTDHIYPQNRMWCGLNVKGNLIIVDRSANSVKGSLDVDTFLLKDTKVIKDIDELGRTRQERLDIIKNFQKKYEYDPLAIRDIVSPLLEKRYEEVRKEQEDFINNALIDLKNNNIKIIDKAEDSQQKAQPSSKKTTTELIFNPSDEKEFVDKFIKKQEARFILTYDTGAVKETIWKCGRFDHSSNLRANVQSRPFWRSKRKDGLIKVEAIVD